ncbi:MAG: DNA polymerase III subunit beta [Kiritimatiellae bacterium]|nr:DNA polymerase III subunit beta [Kiritimatiellia bacterium]
MRIKLEKALILDGLQKVQSIVNQRTTLPILSNILFRAEGDELTLYATDIEVSVRTRVKAEVHESGGTTLPARRIGSIFKELSDQEIELFVDEKDIATIQSGTAVFKIVGISEEDFPSMPELQGERIYTLDQAVFREMLQKTIYASSMDETRMILNGVLVSFKDEKITVVATDGRRLALVEQELEFPQENEYEFVIPTKTVNELVRTLDDKGQIKIQILEKQVAFEFGNMLIISKVIEGNYPNFRQVIPSQCEVRIPVERESLLTAVKRVALIAKEQESTVRLSFGKHLLEISTEAQDIGEAHETIPIKYDGKEINVAFNPDFLMDPLRNLQSDEVFMELTDDLSPGVMKSNVPFIYVIMPMRIT